MVAGRIARDSFCVGQRKKERTEELDQGRHGSCTIIKALTV